MSTNEKKLTVHHSELNTGKLLAGDSLTGVLSANVIPAATRSCLNCKTPMLGPFCYQCGQHERLSIRHFGLLLRDIIHDVFDLDSRMVRTLKPLLTKPGFLTNEYFAGRRQRYVPPLRLYVIASLLFFLMINTLNPVNDDIFKFDDKEISDEQKQKIDKALDDPNVRAELEKANINIEVNPKTGIPWFAADAKKANPAPEDNAPSPSEPDSKSASAIGESVSSVEPKTGERENEASSPQDWLSSSEKGPRIQVFSPMPFLPDNVNTWLEESNVKVNKLLRENPKIVFEAALSVLPQSMFIVLPIFALLLKLSYPFSGRYYIEHLMVAFYSHSFMYVAFTCAFLLGLAQEIPLLAATWVAELLDWGKTALLFWIPIYLFIMQRRVYQQGYFMTWLKFSIVGIIYSVLLSITIALDILVGVINH